jgi:hypothetical protein
VVTRDQPPNISIISMAAPCNVMILTFHGCAALTIREECPEKGFADGP